jgi:hypothetical protein
MSSSGMLRRVALVRTDGEPILVTLMMEAQCSSEPSVLTKNTLRNIPEDDILHGDQYFRVASVSPYSCRIAFPPQSHLTIVKSHEKTT